MGNCIWIAHKNYNYYNEKVNSPTIPVVNQNGEKIGYVLK
ncbi:hypothetical protein JFP838_pA0314 (plasmid) [Clostridium perfringens]|uniref:Uncharacterized protein n=1 Tax=Clostridium perfringens TaxID=1502 RepID=A0A140GRS1_CLOPF|nr:hypothetical protein JFP838_pA0314 [Clostridium perfringens]